MGPQAALPILRFLLKFAVFFDVAISGLSGWNNFNKDQLQGDY